MIIRSSFLIAVVFVLSSCTAIQIKPVDPSLNLKHVCIQENPKVIIADLMMVLRDGFDRHGISTEVITGAAPDQCEYVLTYTALQSWDISTFLSYAYLRLDRKGHKIASAEYRLRSRGGFSLMKWQGTKTKLDPLIDELLAAY